MTIEEFSERLKEKINEVVLKNRNLIDENFENALHGDIRAGNCVEMGTQAINACFQINEKIDALLQEAKPRTNFEKWKDGLTVEQLYPMVRCECQICPAFLSCRFLSKKYRQKNEVTSCEKVITAWANERCEE